MNTRVESRGRNRIRGKKRIEIIQKFLEGEEDPKYEVVPTVTEGKYFVRPRKNESKSELKRHDMNEEEEEIEQLQRSHELRRSERSERAHRAIEGLCPEQPKEKIKPKQKDQYGSLEPEDTTYDPTISYQILEQLKLLGEEQKLKREKKEQKKLVKATIRKQLKKQLKRKEPEPESCSSEEYDYEEYESPEEEEPKLLFKPTPIRRKVNLNK